MGYEHLAVEIVPNTRDQAELRFGLSNKRIRASVPETGTVAVMVGSSLARDTAWVELPEEIRLYPEYEEELAAAEDSYWRDVWRSGGERGPAEDDSDDPHSARC